jgi:hypothetical protein
MQREDAVTFSQGVSLRQWIRVNVLTVGRRLLALKQMRALAAARGEPPLIDSIDQLIAYDEELIGRENLWRQQRDQSLTRPEGKRVDALVDRQISLVFSTSAQCLEGLDPLKDAALRAKGEAMLGGLFPNGVGAITSLPYDDELAVVEHIIKGLEGEWAPVVAELGLTRQVARLRALGAEYAAALGKLPQVVLDFKTLRAERWLGHELMLGVIAQVLALYHGPDPKSAASREALLLPIRAQDRRISEYIKRRSRVSDVNPDTGEELAPDDLSDPLDADEMSAPVGGSV